MTEENKEKGFIKVYRSIWKNPISEKPNYLCVWMYLLSHANHQDKHKIINNKKILIRRGTFIGSLRSISKHFGISISTVKYIIDYFVNDEMIEHEPNSNFSLFKIKNYSSYNKVEHEPNTNETRMKTTNKEKKEKKEKNKEDIAEASSAKTDLVPDLTQDKQFHIQIIGLYARAKKMVFDNKEQQSGFIKRNLRSARTLTGYDFQRIANTMKYLIDNADFKWTLESVGKYIDEDLNNLNTNRIVKI